MEQVRVDKWLWAARFYKTRSLATDAVLGGHVQVNGSRVKPAKDVRVGDRLDLRIGTVPWSIVVTGVKPPVRDVLALFLGDDPAVTRIELL